MKRRTDTCTEQDRSRENCVAKKKTRDREKGREETSRRDPPHATAHLLTLLQSQCPLVAGER